MINLSSVMVIAVLLLLARALSRIVGRVRRREAIRLGDCALAAVPLVIVGGAISLWMLILGALSHSQSARSQAVVGCVLTFGIVAVAPLLGLFIYRKHHMERLGADSAHPPETDRDRFDRRLRMIRNTAFVAGSTVALFVVLFVSQMDVWPPLHLVIRCNCPSIATFLIESGVNLDERDGQGYSPLNHAIMERNRSLVVLLLDKGADVNGGGGSQTPLFSAIRVNAPDLVGLLLDRGADPEPRGNYRTSPLCAAVWNPKMVEMLLAKGAKVNASTSMRSPLACACATSRRDTVRLLLAKGPDLNAKDSLGRTALMNAVIGGDLEIVRMLVEQGADLNMEDNQGRTALSLAEQNRRGPVADLLKAHGAKDKRKGRDARPD